MVEWLVLTIPGQPARLLPVADLQLAAGQVLRPPTLSRIITIVVGEINNSEALIILLTIIRIAILIREIPIRDLPGKVIRGVHGMNQTLAIRLEVPVLILDEAAADHRLAEAVVVDHQAQVRDHQAAETN
jgi:hypothetical protein